MKAKHLLWVWAVSGLVACNLKSDPIQSFIPGTYVCSVRGQFGQADDTLTITLVNANAYSILRKMGYQAIRDGKVLPKHFKLQKLDGTYDAQKQVLNETTNGRLFSFDPAERQLTVNGAVYRKL